MVKYEKITNYLNRCVEKDALSHAYIFYGPDEDFKNKTAFWFANKILKNENFKFHPDLFSIKSEFNEAIVIDLIRQLKSFLTLRPYSSQYKTVIIEAAEKLNSYAQNALLKVFEEAPGHAVIILCVKTLDSISATIVSRAVRLPFWQSPGESSPPAQIISDIFEDLFRTEVLNKYDSVEKLSNYKTLEIFGTWLNFLRRKFRDNPTKELAKLLTKSRDIYFKLNETNINPKFAYDELVLSLWRI